MSKKVAILGAKESGVSAALLAHKLGYTVFVSDYGKVAASFAQKLIDNGIEWEENQHSEHIILSADLVIISPGVPQKAPIVQAVLLAGIELIAEVEFAFRNRNKDSKIIAITGSNGKTTTTLLCQHLFQSANMSSVACGNVGLSFSRALLDHQSTFYIIELSSFQLDNIVDFKPNVAVLLNITPDHLDRYEYCFENYARAKFNIIKNQDKNDLFVFNLDDVGISKFIKDTPIVAQKCPFTLSNNIGTAQIGACLSDNETEIIFKTHKIQFSMPTEDLPLDGKHNVLNIMAATDSFLAHSSIDPRSLKQGLSTFSNVEHRIEKVRVLEGVTFINDSKATNVNAVWYALESIKNPIIWLVGGKDKGNDYEILKDFVASKVSDIICIGKDNKAIIKAFDDCTAKPIMEIADMTKAVNYAYTQAKDGYTILLSPACSSFDLYENYQKRGDAFRRAAVRVRRENMY